MTAADVIPVAVSAMVGWYLGHRDVPMRVFEWAMDIGETPNRRRNDGTRIPLYSKIAAIGVLVVAVVPIWVIYVWDEFTYRRARRRVRGRHVKVDIR